MRRHCNSFAFFRQISPQKTCKIRKGGGKFVVLKWYFTQKTIYNTSKNHYYEKSILLSRGNLYPPRNLLVRERSPTKQRAIRE